jgi:hypothetical protein
VRSRDFWPRPNLQSPAERSVHLRSSRCNQAEVHFRLAPAKWVWKAADVSAIIVLSDWIGKSCCLVPTPHM